MKQSFFSIIFILLAFFVVSNANARESIGFVALLNGKVEAFDEGKSFILKAQDKVFQGQRIVSYEGSKAQLIFNDNSIFTIGENSEILLDKYIYDPKTDEGFSIIEATKGIFKFVTGKIAKKTPKQVKINTPFATIGVRGSGGVIEVLPNGETLLSVTDCCLNFGPRGKEELSIPLNKVNVFSRITSKGGLPSAPEKISIEKLNLFKSSLGKNAVLPSKKVADVKNVEMKVSVGNLEKSLATKLVSRVEGRDLESPVVSISRASQERSLVEERIANPLDFTKKGFAAGFVRESSQYVALQSAGTPTAGTINDVVVTRSAEGDLNANVALYDATDGGVKYKASISGVNFENFNNNADFSLNGGDVLDGLGKPVSGITSLNSGGTCSSCDFVSWGYWEVDPVAVGGTSIQVPFVIGDVTTDISDGRLASLGSVVYNGVTKGFESNGSTISSVQTGSFTAGVDLGTRTLESFDANIGNFRLQGSALGAAISSAGEATFEENSAMNVLHNGNVTTGATYSVSGALFGANAEAIGGSIVIDDTGGASGASAAGVFVGAR